jgi:tungstate transport system permease protein
MLLTGDREVWSAIAVSFSVSLRAILIASPPAITNTLMSVPAVVIGLTVYLALSKNGIAGDLRLLYTQPAMIIGQVIICFPLLIAMAHATFAGGDKLAYETARTLGAKKFSAMLTVFIELRFGLLAAIIAGFSRIIAEIGCSMMVGGNILDHTRNIPTAIALETSKGEFAMGVALGIVLLSLTMLLNVILAVFQGEGR